MKKIAVLIAGLLAVSCVVAQPPQLTPLELQSLQQREFEVSKDVTFASVVSVFQDLGYIIQSADVETGFITATGSSASRRDWVFTGNQYTTQTRATAYIEGVSESLSRVRLNFVTGTQTSTGYGQTGNQDVQILDPVIYQNAFEKIETAVFIRSS